MYPIVRDAFQNQQVAFLVIGSATDFYEFLNVAMYVGLERVFRLFNFSAEIFCHVSFFSPSRKTQAGFEYIWIGTNVVDEMVQLEGLLQNQPIRGLRAFSAVNFNFNVSCPLVPSTKPAFVIDTLSINILY